MLTAELLKHVDPETLRAVRSHLVHEMHLEEIERLEMRRRGLKFLPQTCAVCNKKTHLGPLCFDHMDTDRPMWRLWLDYFDSGRRRVRKIDEFLMLETLRAESPGTAFDLEDVAERFPRYRYDRPRLRVDVPRSSAP